MPSRIKSNIRARALCVASAAAALLHATASGAAATVRETVLENGLKVVVQEDHRSPTVVSQVWYRCGSMDEFNGTTGVAHVLEHMMFKGTEKVPASRFSKIIAAAGGRDNAFTSHDYTTYFQQLEKSRLPLALEMEADRMNNLTFSEKEFAPEIKVIMEERRLRTDDQPRALLSEQLSASAFVANPYHHPIIGWTADLQSMKLADARAWYERWYAPNNATLVVVGDVDADEVFALAKKHFGPLARKPLPERKPQPDPEQTGERRVHIKASAELPVLALGWKAPVLRDPSKDWEPFALEVLSGVLDGHASARLPKSLVRESRVATSVDVGYDSVRRGPGMFVIDGTPSEGRSVAELETALKAQIEKLKTDGVGDDELARVKAQVVASHVYQRDSMFYQAMQIGGLENAGLSWRALDTIVEKIAQVTAEQVRDVARKYLVDDRLTVAILDPQTVEAPKGAPRRAEGGHNAR